MLRPTTILLALLATPLLAQDAERRSGEGDLYDVAVTGIDVTLRSQGSVARSVGGASLDGPDVLTLHPDCSAEADGQAGTWGQGLLGFEVALPGRTVTFPVQRLTIAGPDCPPR